MQIMLTREARFNELEATSIARRSYRPPIGRADDPDSSIVDMDATGLFARNNVLAGVFLDPATGAVYAFGAGYLADLLGGETVGVFMFDRMIIFMAANILSKQFYARNALAQLLLTALLAFVEILFIMLLSSVFGGSNTLRGLAGGTCAKEYFYRVIRVAVVLRGTIQIGRTAIPAKASREIKSIRRSRMKKVIVLATALLIVSLSTGSWLGTTRRSNARVPRRRSWRTKSTIFWSPR